MVKKPKLSQSLANYTKKQAEKIKEKARFDAIELMNKNRAKKNPNAPRGGDNLVETRDKKNKSSLNENVPCHVWTDSDKLQKRTKLPFHPKNNSVVLLIGEGDFSYCRALVSAFESVQLGLDADEGIETDSNSSSGKKWKVVATALDTREIVLRKYRKASGNLAWLENRKEVEILFGIDGTKLHQDRELKRIFNPSVRAPTRIIFNFPHTGAGIKDRERNIVAQQKMLQGFFGSVIKFMQARGVTSTGCNYSTTMIKKDRVISENVSVVKKKSEKNKNLKTGKRKGNDSDDDESGDELIIDDPELLANNAKIIKDTVDVSDFDSKEIGESFEIHCTFKTGDPYDAWKPKNLATRTGHLVCLQTFKFVPELYPGYQHCRTIGENRAEFIETEGWNEFLAGKPAKTFVFSYKK